MAESWVESIIELDENAILAQLNSVAQELGLINEVFSTSRIYLYYAVFARVWGNLTQIVLQYLDNIDLDNTTDEALLERQIKPFVTKRYAKVAKVILKFSRRPEYDGPLEDILIPRDMEVSTEGDNPIIFTTAESRILWKNTQEILIPAYSVEFGSINNVMANTLTYFDDVDSYSAIQVTNPDAAFGGSDEETAYDTRDRIGLFRYGKDGSKESIQATLFENGISYYGFNIVEYWEGFGTVLICMDIDSEEEFNDIIAIMEAQKPGHIKYIYTMAEPVFVNLDIEVKLLGEQIFTKYQQDEVAQHIRTAVELFFNGRVYVGKPLSVNRLESFLLQYLFDEKYDIYEVEIGVESNSDLKIDSITGQLSVEQFQKITPNLLSTTIEYELE